MAKPKRQGLGKGLDALFEDNFVENNAVSELKVSEIEPNKDQPRRLFDEQALRELADSIALHGILQPLVVRPLNTGGYQIVAGERRWRASRIAGLSEVPVVIKELSDSETLEIAIIENLQREDLNIIELAQGYKALMDEHSFTQEQVAEKVGKSRPVVANSLRLLNLPEMVIDEVRHGALSQGHARALLAIEDIGLLEEIAEEAINKKLSVREIEKIAKKLKEEPKVISEKKKAKAEINWGNNSIYKEIELALSEELGRRVSVRHDKNKGEIVLEFYNEKDLKELANKLSQ